MNAIFSFNLRELLREYNFFYSTSLIVFFILFFAPFFFFFSFSDLYTTPKWILTLFSVNLSIFIFLFKSKKLHFPELPKLSLIFIALITLCILFNSHLHNVSLFSYENMRRFAFWGLSIFFFNFFLIDKNQSFHKIENVLFLATFVFLIAALTEYTLYPGARDTSKERASLTFGNINFCAEFVGFSFAFLGGALIKLWRKFQSSFFLETLAALSLAYLYFVSCRSIVLAVLVILLLIAFENKANLRKLAKIVGLSIIVIFFIKGLIFLLYTGQELRDFKETFTRWVFYKCTLQMIYENLLGVGVGQYEFGSLPYLGPLFPRFNERLLYMSPHDEFLHFLAEDGFILSFLFAGFLITLTCYFWKDIKQIFSSHPVFIYFSAILFSQSLFQFPFIDPVPYFLTALMIGYFFALKGNGIVTYQLKPTLKGAFLTLNFILFVSFGSYFASRYISHNYPRNLELNKAACAFGNRNWFACLNVAALYMDQKNYLKAEPYILQTLYWQPLNFQGIRALAFLSLFQGDRSRACTLFRQYDSFFENQSSVHPIILHECRP